MASPFFYLSCAQPMAAASIAEAAPASCQELPKLRPDMSRDDMYIEEADRIAAMIAALSVSLAGQASPPPPVNLMRLSAILNVIGAPAAILRDKRKWIWLRAARFGQVPTAA